jgi:chromosome partitioning protein
MEIDRTCPIQEEIAEVLQARQRPVRSAVLLNRCITRAHSTADARQALQGLGFDVLPATVPRLEVYAQSFGLPVRPAGYSLWQKVASDLIQRCDPRCPVLLAVGTR